MKITPARVIFWFFLFISVVLGTLYWIENTPKALAAKERSEVERQQADVDGIIQRIRYIQDPRTTPPTCYAHSQPMVALTALHSCEGIPKELLTIGRF